MEWKNITEADANRLLNLGCEALPDGLKRLRTNQTEEEENEVLQIIRRYELHKEQTLLQMKAQCEEAIRLVEESLTHHSTENRESYLGWWRYALQSVNTLLDLFHDDPARDTLALQTILEVAMVSYVEALDGFKPGIHQSEPFPDTSRIRKSQRL